ncbi:unnamed protein product [Rhizoctonia solani]|uniref:Uncharacterized protein n=1 Tax=Rhizoctonia solani TaxID=456999 RepID=A0A8H3D228_9AGAM|nr:unnamed protein product [Rhizoctonia solani]
MSGSHTPDSVSSIRSGSNSSGRRLDSNTTPSPTGGNRSPKFNPRALSHKLSMLEASQALAQAASTLSIAAKAMSKAAASLAAVSDYSDEDYTYEVGYPGDSEDWAESPDWTRSSYNLMPVSHGLSEGVLGATDEGYKLRQIDESAPVDETLGSQQEHSSESGVDVNTSGTGFIGGKPTTVPQLATAQAPSEVFSSPCTFNVPSDPVYSMVDPTPVPVRSEIDPSLEDNMTKDPGSGVKASERISTTPVSIPTASTETTHASTNNYWGPSGSSAPSSQPAGSTQIVLERGFDTLPALCYLAGSYVKTICIYNYPGTSTTTMHIEAMLKKNTKLPVVVPESAKQDRLAAATRKFNLTASCILVWPGYKKLPKITGLANSPDIQLVHIGDPNQLNADIVCLNTTFIVAKSNLGQPRESVRANYPLDPSNGFYNQQGPGSPLEPYRIWLRSRFSQVASARVIYWDLIVQRRKQEPKKAPVEIVRLANRFAEEFLLRGKSTKYGDPVGGPITVTDAQLKGHKMESAVKAGVLLVG